MPDVIYLLPDAVANQIAAGEVVQRPSSAVKELMENAVDAGAGSIRLILKESGKGLIQVVDDGCGMSPTDARAAFERHATSKIREAKDLFTIHTMGFRGEALASIASISQVEMKTRRSVDEVGSRIVIEGFEVKLQEPCQTPVGTNFLMKNLFYNIPARRNFLKSNTVEMRHNLDEFERISLANSGIAFSLHHNDQEIFHLEPGNLRQRIVGVFGKDVNKHLVPVEEETDVLKLSGFVGKPEIAKKTRGQQFFFVNNRFIKSQYLHHAVQTAFEELLPKDAYPFYIIFLDLDPARIDINVHPTKQEIKFEDERLIYNYLKVAVRHALGRNSITPSLDFEQQNIFSKQFVPVKREPRPEEDPSTPLFNRKTTEPSAPGRADYRVPTAARNWEELYAGLENNDWKPDDKQTTHEESDLFTIKSGWSDDVSDDAPNPSFPAVKAPYQVHQSFIVSQIKSGFILVDQQAAHERVLYEKYLESLNDNQQFTQRELFPTALNFTPAQAAILRDILPQINRLGFDLQDFGSNAFVVHGVPADWPPGQNEQQIIEQLLDQFQNNVDQGSGVPDRVARAMARGSAVKRGAALTEVEMTALIDQLFACTMPFKSPSGRNCFLTFDLETLEKEFSG